MWATILGLVTKLPGVLSGAVALATKYWKILAVVVVVAALAVLHRVVYQSGYDAAKAQCKAQQVKAAAAAVAEAKAAWDKAAAADAARAKKTVKTDSHARELQSKIPEVAGPDDRISDDAFRLFNDAIAPGTASPGGAG